MGPFDDYFAENYYEHRATPTSNWCYMINFDGLTKIGHTTKRNPMTRIRDVFRSYSLPDHTKMMAYDCGKFGFDARMLEIHLHRTFRDRRDVDTHISGRMAGVAMLSGRTEVFRATLEEIAPVAYKFINFYRQAYPK